MERCILWNTPAKLFFDPEYPKCRFVYSPRAGGYYIEGPSVGEGLLNNKSDDLCRRLSYWIWQENIAKNIDGSTSLEDWPMIKIETIKEAMRRPEPSDDACIENILYQMDKSSDGKRGAQFKYESFQRGLDLGPATGQRSEDKVNLMKAASYCRGNEDFDYLIQAMSEERLIKFNKDLFMLTIKGRRKIKEKHPSKNHVFVAMWFDESKSMDIIFDKAIEPAVEAMGYEAIRADRDLDNKRIDRKIEERIRTSKFIIADVTADSPENTRGGVYYEAGYAQGCGKHVIFTCRSDMMKYLPFNTRQYYHIDWEDGKLDILKERIVKQIKETIK